MRILVVDDDRAVRESLRRSLAFNGYQVDLATDGQAALTAVSMARPDAMVLDVMMPRLDGLEVCRRLRGTGDDLPILVLTARDAVSDRVAGLDAGADDYLSKPFELDELLARLRALLRRAIPAADGLGPGGGALRLAALRIDPAARRAWWTDSEVRLSKTEFDLLELMVRNEGVVLEHSTLYQRIWGYDFGTSSKNLAVYVGYLRRKLADVGAPNLIHTVRGVGYAARRP